ncbi:MAG: LysR substrate-binding domain-containing protein [Leucobacter sp.]
MSGAVPEVTLRQMAYFVAVVEHGSFAAAAARLFVSPSAIADSVADLEAALGAQLCIRRRAHGVSLTSAGAKAAEDARRLLAQAREFQLSLASSPDELVGPIAVGCYPTLASTVLPPLLDVFEREHPRVELLVVEASQDLLCRDVITGGIDLAFVYETLVTEVPARRRLAELRAHALFAEGHPLAAEPSVSLEQLAEEPLILFDTPPADSHTLSLFSARGLMPRIRHRTGSYEAARTLVGRGLGYGIFIQHRPANMASLDGDPLIAVEIEPAVAPVGIDAICSQQAMALPRVRALLDFASGIAWEPAR